MSLKKIFKGSLTDGKAEFPKDFGMIAPEDAAIGVRYAFTWSPIDDILPPPHHVFNHTNMLYYFDQHKEIIEKLKGCGVTLYLEFSKKGRLHYHGYLIITDYVKFYLHDVNLLAYWGNMKLDNLSDPLLWDLYIHKNKDKIHDYFKDLKIDHLTGYYPLQTAASEDK